MTPITVRQRLQDYEFTDEQELTLTLELLGRIEKDIEELKAAKTRDGFSLYVALGGIAATLFILLGELSKLSGIPFTKIGVIFFALILLSKIPWAIFQLLTLDKAINKQRKPGRFYWTNDLFFELRPSGIFQAIIFVLLLIFVFFVPIPRWVSIATSISFLLYIFMIGLVFVLSFRKEPYRPDNANKGAMIGLPVLFLIFTGFSIAGLGSRMKLPVGNETQPYVIAGLLFVLVFFFDILIRLTTPSLLLEKLQTLRNDIIFLRANLEDAWTRYEVYVDGHEISEELRADMDDIIRCFNTIDLHQSQKVEMLSAVQVELEQLQTGQDLTKNDFDSLNAHKTKFFLHVEEINNVFEYLNPRLKDLGEKVNKISRATQEWKRADEYHQYFLSRLARLAEQDAQIAQDGKKADEKLQSLQPKRNENKKS